MPGWYEMRGQDCLVRVRVQPRSSREGFDGEREGRLRVRVSSPPADGAANERLVRLLSYALGVPKTHISLIRGAKNRDKDLLVRGIGDTGRDLSALSRGPVARKP